MSSFHQKITRSTKEQRKIAHSKEQITSPERAPEETYISNLPGRDFKTSVLNIFKDLKENTKK